MSTVTFRGMNRVKAMLRDYDERSMSNRLRRGTRAGAAEFRDELRAEGAGPQFPLSFRKTKTSSSTRGGPSGREIEARVRPRSPLFNIFGPGARAHTIAPGESVTGRRGRKGGRPRKGALAGPAGGGSWDTRGRKRSRRFFSSKPVRHPGMAARELLVPSFAHRVGRAEDAVALALFGPGAGSSPGPDLGTD